MSCARCSNVEFSEVVEDAAIGDIVLRVRRCSQCSLSVALSTGKEWHPIESLLFREVNVDGFTQALTVEDKIVHFVLRQLLHNEQLDEKALNEVIFDVPDEDDIVTLLWSKGKAAGFYTLKPKGTWIQETCDIYGMVTLDTMYVCKSERSKGHGQNMLKHIRTLYPSEDVGISTPLSPEMYGALQKFLTCNPELRSKLWEIEGCGGEGRQKLVWFVLLSKARKS